MRVSVLTGPGHHGPEVLAALRGRGWLYRAIRDYPHFVVEDGQGRTVARAPLFDLAVRASWAAWRRLPRLGSGGFPRGPQVALQGRLAAAHLGRPDLVLAWLQVGLESLRRAHARGIPAVLEHPMNHLQHFDDTVRREQARWGPRLARHSWFSAIVRRRMQAEYREARHIFVLSSFSRRTFVEHGVDPARLIELPLGIDHRLFTPRPGRRPGPARLLFVGRIELMKGTAYLLEAARRLRGAPFELSLVGPATADTEALLARFSDVPVRLETSLDRAALVARYQDADVLVFPSVNDALGLVMLEAMASGVPVVASASTGAPDVLREGVDGFIVPAADAEALAARLELFVRDPSLGLELGRCARDRIEQNYTLHHHAERLASALSSLVPSP